MVASFHQNRHVYAVVATRRVFAYFDHEDPLRGGVRVFIHGGTIPPFPFVGRTTIGVIFMVSSILVGSVLGLALVYWLVCVLLVV